jgi:hypothetical protein
MIYLIDPKQINTRECLIFCKTLCGTKNPCPLDLISPLYGVPN